MARTGVTSTSVLNDQVAEMFALHDFGDARPEHLSLVYYAYSNRAYGAPPIDAKTAKERAPAFVDEVFSGSAVEACRYLGWLFGVRLPHEKEKSGGKARHYGAGLVFSAALAADYFAATKRSPADAPDEEAPDAPAGDEDEDGRSMLRRGDHVELAELLVAELRSGEIAPVSSLGAIYRYEPERGIWPALDDDALSRRVQAFAGMPIDGTRNGLSVRSGDVGGTVKLTHARIGDDRFFDDASRGLAFADGFVRLKDDGSAELVPHAPGNRARFAYPFGFGEKTPRPKWIKFLRSFFVDDADAKQKIALIREFAGASLLGLATRYQRCLVLDGDGDNGKSTLLNILTAAMPPGSTCAVPPQSWGNEYRRALMAGKLFNVVSELPEQDIIASESFKAIITGDAIDARVIRETPFTYRPSAGHAFAANTLPGTQDQSDGFWRRFAVVTFGRKFTEAEKNATIADEILADELPGIVRWMVEGAAALIARGAYVLPSSHDAALSKWRRNADQVSAFLDECTRPAEAGEGTGAKALYDAYAKWAPKSGHRALSSTKFGMRLSKIGKGSRHTKTGNVVPVVLTLAGWART